MVNVKCHVKKDDKVKVLVGKDKGKIGKVLSKISAKNRLIVENVNMVKRHVKPSAQNKQGGIIDKESSIHFSNVMLMCSDCMESTRPKIKFLDGNKKVRVCKKCGEIIK